MHKDFLLNNVDEKFNFNPYFIYINKSHFRYDMCKGQDINKHLDSHSSKLAPLVTARLIVQTIKQNI